MSDLPIHYAPARKMLWILGVLALGMTAIGVGIMIVGGLVGALIWAHGYRGSAAGVMRNGSLRRMVHDQGLALIALQGVGDLWDLPNGPRTPDSTGAVDYIDAVIADAQVQFGIDTNELVASGFSAGGCWSGTSPARGLIPLQGSYPMQAPSGWSRSAIARHLSPVWFTFMGMRMALCR